MAIKYTQKVIQHFTSPLNVGDLPNPDAVATEGSPACGDMVTFALKINPKTHIVEDVRFRSFGCASNIATGSMATLLAKGKTIEEVKRLTHRDIVDALDGLPAVKLHCSVLAVDGLKAAVHQWEVENGLAEDIRIELHEDQININLGMLLNPRTGKGVLESGMIGKVEVDKDEGKVFIEMKLTYEDERFAQNLEEEIREKIESIPGVKGVIVQFKIRSKSSADDDD